MQLEFAVLGNATLWNFVKLLCLSWYEPLSVAGAFQSHAKKVVGFLMWCNVGG